MIQPGNIDNVVYILGAGFSAPLGIPVMSNFLEKSKDLFARDSDRYKNFVNVFTTINQMSIAKNYYNADLFNIEEILSILEMSEQLGGESKSSSFVEYIIDVIKHYTPEIKLDDYPTSWQSNVFGGQKQDRILNYYGYFVGSLLRLNLSENSRRDFFTNALGDRLSPARYSVITLNYDLVLENCFSHLEHWFHAQGFGFSQDIEESEEQFLKNTHLAKLHGCVSTGQIVPPTWNKGLTEMIKPAWQLAYKLLTEANHIRIIGYSLPIADSYIKYLLKAAIIDCDHLKSIDILCLDDSIKTVEDRYNEFISFPNCRFKNESVIEYLKINHAECQNLSSGTANLQMKGLEIAHKKCFDL